MAKTFQGEWLKYRFQNTIVFSSWVDNCFFASNSHADVLALMNKSEEYLQSVWDLSIKPSSKCIINVAGGSMQAQQPIPFMADTLSVLGHTLSSNGNSGGGLLSWRRGGRIGRI